MDNSAENQDFGKNARGRREFEQYRKTKQKLSPKKAILANCYVCTCYYSDGKEDCDLKDCVFYPYMPYRKNQEKTKREMSEKQRESFAEMQRSTRNAHGTANTTEFLEANGIFSFDGNREAENDDLQKQLRADQELLGRRKW